MYVGWDWASQNHDLTVIDDAGTIQARFAIGHDEASLEGVLHQLASIRDPRRCPWPSNGPMASSSSASSPQDIPWWRCTRTPSMPPARVGVPGEPSPTRLTATCWLTNTDGHRLRRLRPLDSTMRELQALVRMRDDHVTARTAATNQLHALLEAHWPGANAIFSRLGSSIALAFLADYPTPEAAATGGSTPGDVLPAPLLPWRPHTRRAPPASA